VVLVDCEGEGGFEPCPGLGTTVESEERFAEENAWHHPIGFLFTALNEVLDRIGRPVLGEQGLSETETEQLVLGLLRDESGKSEGAGGRRMGHG